MLLKNNEKKKYKYYWTLLAVDSIYASTVVDQFPILIYNSEGSLIYLLKIVSVRQNIIIKD